MNASENSAPVVLVPGHWLGAWAWDEVADALRAHGHAVTAVTLPGADPDDPERARRTPTEQAEAVEAVVRTAAREAGQPVVLVGHSGANHPVSAVLGRVDDDVARVVWVDSGPIAPGVPFDPASATDEDERPLPPFEVLGEGASLEGLDDAALQHFRERAVPVPGPVLREPAPVEGSGWRSVPTTIVACSIPAAVMLQLAQEGHPMMAPVAELTDVEVVDLPTGHWPMWSEPQRLADVLAQAARHRTAT